MYAFFYDTPIGKLGIAQRGDAICRILFDAEKLPGEYEIVETPLLKEAKGQIISYLSGALFGFSLPLFVEGTDFQKRVFSSLCEIPYGKTAAYSEIAKSVGSPKGFRAVGMACNRNPIPIIIPCHRAVGKSGALVGYRGGLEIKKQLLYLESRRTCPVGQYSQSGE